MGSSEEIKLNKESFDSTIAVLMEARQCLLSAKERIVSVNTEMQSEWIGDGGTAFTLSANVLENRFFERINDLDCEINNLNEAKNSMFTEDDIISKDIDDN